MRFVVVVVALSCVSGRALAWGERGHDVVTRVAARLVAARMMDDPSLAAPLIAREHMLAHLSNVPDIVWRGGEHAKVNAPTHYIDWEKILPSLAYAQAPRTYAEAALLAKARGLELASDVGTAPWRVEQLAAAMTAALKKVKQLPPAELAGGKQLEERVNEALLYAGLLSHFVGDLSQPHHNTDDHDGWKTGQGGIHAYFESELVSAAPLQLEADVFAVALATQPARALSALTGQGNEPLAIALAESFDALRYVEEIRDLDARYAVTVKGDKKKPATRKPASVVLPYLQSRITERLATAADVLATLWINTWVASGKPDMRAYKSYVYPTHPDFIAPTYVPVAASGKDSNAP